MSSYDVFISGETMDLCCPTEEAIFKDGWHDWFNNPKTTRYLVNQGLFPNTVKDQLRFLESVIETRSRVLLLIKPKDLDCTVGVISLSNINFQQRQADTAMVIGRRGEKSKHNLLLGMEAKCKITEHAFENLGVERINSGQVAPLRQWQHWQLLFGFRFEGIQRKKNRKGHRTYDVILSSCLLEDYLVLKEKRNGVLWPGAVRMYELIKLLPKEAFDVRMERIMNEEWEKYYSSLCLI